MGRRLMEKYSKAFSLLVTAEGMPACPFPERRRTRYSCLRRVEGNTLTLIVQWSSIASIRSAHA
jgi:hypothetical protein